MLLTLAVMAGFAASPVELKVYKTNYNSAEFDWWYFGYGDYSRFAMFILDEQGNEIVMAVMSPEEADYCANLDGIELPVYKGEDERDDGAHHWISTYWVLNNLNGVAWGEDAIKQKYVYEVKGTDNKSHLALQPGKYKFRVWEFLYDSESGKGQKGDGYTECAFTINGTAVSELKAEVAADHKTATITWTEPKLPYGVHLYMSVQTGSDVAFDNYSQNISPKSPLTVSVMEGRTYSVTAQYVNGKKEPQGGQVKIYFTVGTNTYIPSGLNAKVVSEDYVEFSWSAATKADFYHVNVYQNGITYASYSTQEQKLTKKIPTGTYTWDVAAYEKDEELYYPLSEYVKGNEFTTQSAGLPEGTIEMNVWGMDAILFEEDLNANRFGWMVEFATGTKNGSGLPMPWFYIYADRELALSGFYSSALGNIAISTTKGEDTQMNMDGTQNGTVQATSAELKLEFEGFDTEAVMAGYNIPYYGGYFKMTLSNGDSYYGEFNGLYCLGYVGEEWMAGSPSTVISMLGEDGTVIPNQAIEDVQSDKVQSTKVLRDGQIYLMYEGQMYDVQGRRVK